MALTLESLPPALLERHVCAFLDAASLARFELGANRELRDGIRLSALWAAHVAQRFSLTDLPKFSSSVGRDGDKLVGWKRVFVVAQQDARALAAAAQDQDAVRVYGDRRRALALTLRPRELSIRDELVLMQALRRFPTSDVLVSLYARMLCESQWAARVTGGGGRASGADSRRSGLPLLAAPASPRLPLPLAFPRS